MSRHIFCALKFHHASGFDIVEALLDKRSQPHQLAFGAPEKAQPGRNHSIRILINASLHLLFDESPVLRDAMDSVIAISFCSRLA